MTVNTVSRVDAALEIGQLSETVTVQSESQLLQTDKADTHTEIRSDAITAASAAAESQLPDADQPGARCDTGPTAEQRSRYAGSRADDERQRSEPQQQRHEDRWCDQREHLAAAPHDAGLAGRDRRHGEREHEQLRRRAGYGRRCRDHGHHQVRHERVQGVGVRVLQQREDERLAVLRDREEGRPARTSPARRSAVPSRRTSCSSSARGKGSIRRRRTRTSSTCRPAALRVGDFSQAYNSDGSLQVIYDPMHGQPRTGRAGRRFRAIRIPAKLHRRDCRGRSRTLLPERRTCQAAAGANVGGANTIAQLRAGREPELRSQQLRPEGELEPFAADAGVGQVLQDGRNRGFAPVLPGYTTDDPPGDTTVNQYTFGTTWTMNPTTVFDATYGISKMNHESTAGDAASRQLRPRRARHSRHQRRRQLQQRSPICGHAVVLHRLLDRREQRFMGAGDARRAHLRAGRQHDEAAWTRTNSASATR